MNSNTTGIDGLSRSGASELARMIEKYWHDKGYLVKCRVESLTLTLPRSKRKAEPAEGEEEKSAPQQNLSLCCLRSDMVNGMPPHRLPEGDRPLRFDL